MNEEWRSIPNFSGYIVSSKGRVARVLKGKMQDGRRLYEIGNAYKGTKGRRGRKSLFAARAIALAWHGPPPHQKMDAAHIDGNRQNDVPENIAWKTRRDNCADKWIHNTQPFGERHHLAKLTMVKAEAIRIAVAKGRTFTTVAKKHGVSRSTVRRIVNRERIGGWDR